MSLGLAAVAFAQSYSVDGNGWSIITPSSDSRLIYVSAAGNDSTAQVYTTAQVGANPRSPSIGVNAYQTLAAARAQMRDGYPDWLILRRGDTFTEALNLGAQSFHGRSASERLVYTYYGTSGNRPLLTQAYWNFYSANSGNFAIVGLEVYYRARDPQSSFFVSFASNHNIILNVVDSQLGNILVEDCVFRHGRDNISLNLAAPPAFAPYVDIRRSANWDSHDDTGADAQADRNQGIFVQGVNNLMIEDCFFDHNGWAENANGTLAGNGRSWFSHNIYLQNGSNNTAVVGNIIARAASVGVQARAGNYLEDNLFLLNAIGGFSAALPTETGEGAINEVIDNVLIAGTDHQPTVWGATTFAPDRGWGLEVKRTDQGLYQGNIFLDEASTGTDSRAMIGENASGSQLIRVWDNIIRNWRNSSNQSVTGLSPTNYDVQDLIIDGVNQSTGQNVTFVDGNRTLSTYLTSIGSSGTNLTFLANARAAWLGAPRTFPLNYRASTVNTYFRAGFTIAGGNSVPSVTTTSLPNGTQGAAYSQALQAAGGDGALVWSLASGTLPSGLSLSSGGVISGTPSGTGTSNFTVRVADSDAVTGSTDEDTQALAITVSASSNSVPNITTTSLPAVNINTTYSQALQATGGNGALVWSVASGSLPIGLTLSSAGVISGTPTTTGTSSFTVRVADSDGITGAGDEDTQALNIQVNSTGTVTAPSGGAYFNTQLASSQTGTFTVTFTGSVSAAPLDAVIALSNAPVFTYADMACAVRFNPSGNIDARNGGTYAAVATIPYTAGVTYSFRLVVNVSAKTYSIYVTPPSSAELTVGTNYAFRTEQAAITSLNYWNARVQTTPTGNLTVGSFTLGGTPVATIAATDSSAGEPSNHGQFTVTLSPAPASNVTVNLSRTGTATNGTDYSSIATTVVVGTSGTATIPVTVTNDSAIESTETVILTVTSGSGYTVGGANSATVTITDDDGLPSPWVTQDIGAVGATGTAVHASGTFTVEGSGADIWATGDEFRYVYQSASGDCTIVARVSGVENTDNWAKVGVMVRETLDANSAYAMTSMSPNAGGTAMFSTRLSAGAGSGSQAQSAQTVPRWVRIVRTGNTFTGAYSANGTTWTSMGSVTITMGSNVYIGLAVTSHNDGTLCTGTFTNVTATP